MGAKGRAGWMGRWRDWIFDHSDELIGLMQRESGKSWGDANIEIFGTDMMNYWAEHAAKFLADETVRPVGTGEHGQETDRRVRALPARRRDHAVELPAGDATARHPSGSDGRLRRAVQTVGVHPAGVAGGRRRLEGDRRAGCSRRGLRRWRNRCCRRRCRRLRDVHRFGQDRPPGGRGRRPAADSVLFGDWAARTP